MQYTKKIMEMKVNKASLYSLMGQYQRSYNINKKLLELGNEEDKGFTFSLLCNLSVDALLLDQSIESACNSLELARKSLVIAETIGAAELLALAYGNIGLAQEKMKDYKGALESYEKCLEYGLQIKDNRIINNGYCNLGRAYEGLGEREEAKINYNKALDTPQPPSSHWCDTEDFRFSPDYLLGKMAFEENNFTEAKKYFQQVMERCDSFRKNVAESLLKICFNDTQKKPYQYLQYILLKEGKQEDALLIAEKGRGRDFYDKVVTEESESFLNTGRDLIQVGKNETVLFLSHLEVINKMCCWLIDPDGKIDEVSLLEGDQWSKLLSELDFAMHNLRVQGNREPIEIRGINIDEEDKKDEDGFEECVGYKDDDEHEGKRYGHAKDSCGYDKMIRQGGHERGSGGRKADSGGPERDIGSYPRDGGGYEDAGGKHEEICDRYNMSNKEDKKNNHDKEDHQQLRAPSKSPQQITTKSLPEVIDQISQLVIPLIEKHVDKLVKSSKHKPKLLIIPQGKTFNIPYGALKLKNGNPLCSEIAPHEIFSYHAYSHCLKAAHSITPSNDAKEILIIGNPTNDLSFAQKEAEFIGNLLGATPLTGPIATRTEVVRRLPHASVIHFACHGAIDGRFLVLAGEGDKRTSTLTMEDISQMTIHADIVVLSACHTARGAISSSEGVIGLARAFFLAGAKSLVTALWAIPDKATEALMKDFYNNLLKGVPVVDALSQSMHKLQKGDFNGVHKWGSFKVLGPNIKVFDKETTD